MIFPNCPFECLSKVTARRPVEPDEARTLVDEVRSFARESHAETFFESHRPLYDFAVHRMEAILQRRFDPAWVSRFFGTPEARLILAVAPDNGNTAYGMRFYGTGEPKEFTRSCRFTEWIPRAWRRQDRG